MISSATLSALSSSPVSSASNTISRPIVPVRTNERVTTPVLGRTASPSAPSAASPPSPLSPRGSILNLTV